MKNPASPTHFGKTIEIDDVFEDSQKNRQVKVLKFSTTDIRVIPTFTTPSETFPAYWVPIAEFETRMQFVKSGKEIRISQLKRSISEKKEAIKTAGKALKEMYLQEMQKYEKELSALEQSADPGELNTDQDLIAKYPKLSKSQRESIANQTQEILSENPNKLTDFQRGTLELYEGLGSVKGVVDKGILHQFYTPYPIIKKMWDLAFSLGVPRENLTMCEPSCGTGRFFKFAPENATCYGFDPDTLNLRIAKLLYPDTERYIFYQQEFETAFLEAPNYSRAIKKSWLPEMDLVIGNPPYGDYMGYYKSYMPKAFKRFEFLFVLLGLKLLKKDGILVYIVSQNFMNNGAMYNNMKEEILKIGEFITSFRLPNGVFSTTDVGTDIIIFKKK